MTKRLTRFFGLIASALVALAGSSCTAMPAAAKTPSEKADALLTGLIQSNDPGFAVLVAQIVYAQGLGE